MCCRETLWSFSSQLITLRDPQTRCDNAQCSSASGTGILIDVKATKYSEHWWGLCSVEWGGEKKRVSIPISVKQRYPGIIMPKLSIWNGCAGDYRWPSGSRDGYVSVSIRHDIWPHLLSAPPPCLNDFYWTVHLFWGTKTECRNLHSILPNTDVCKMWWWWCNVSICVNDKWLSLDKPLNAPCVTYLCRRTRADSGFALNPLE